MRSLILVALLLVTGCQDRRPPAPTAEENQRLDDADRMLNDMSENGAAAPSG